MEKPRLYIGTAGWSYEDWQNIFYPFSHSKTFSWLKYYSRFFNIVEVNASYYKYLPKQIVASWQNQIDSDDFQFSYKLHMDFTHKKSYSEKQVDLVCENLELLREKNLLSGLLIQFPNSFTAINENVEYLSQLVEYFKNYERFIEVRHSSWIGKRAKTVTFCTIDQPILNKFLPYIPTFGNEAAYFRFHGRNISAWQKSLINFGKKQTYEQASERYDYLYNEEEIDSFTKGIKNISDKVQKVIVIFNNHPGGKAIANSFQIKGNLIGNNRIQIPGTIIKNFPLLEKNA